MKIENCAFSGRKIYPTKGMMYIRGDGKSFRLETRRALRSFASGQNPRDSRWTLFFRKLHKKGISETGVKRRVQRTVRPMVRGIVGASLETIKAKQSQQPGERKAAREEAAAKAKKLRKEAREKRRQDKIKAMASQKPVQRTKPVRQGKAVGHSR